MTDAAYKFGYRAPRYRADFCFLLQTEERIPSLVDARCTDLSEGGLAAKTKASLEIGANVVLIVTLPGVSTSLRIAARVINRQVDGYGFAFIFSSQQERSYLHDYLESRRPSMIRSPDLSE